MKKQNIKEDIIETENSMVYNDPYYDEDITGEDNTYEDDRDIADTVDAANVGPDAKSIVIHSIMSDYLRQISVFKTLTAEEEITLFKAYEDGDKDAYETLYNNNLKLVVSVAKHYFKVTESLDPIDLIMEGNIGLATAIMRFDYRRGIKFSTYATHWIRQAITRAISNTSRAVRLPVHLIESTNRYYKYENDRFQQGLPRSTVSDVKRDLGVNEQQAEFMVNSLTGVSNIMSLEQELFTNIQPDEATSLIDLLQAPDNTEDSYFQTELREILFSIIDSWSMKKKNEKDIKKCKDIIIRRYGLNGESPETLQEIANTYGISGERIRQIENSFLRYAKLPKNQKLLAGYAKPPIDVML